MSEVDFSSEELDQTEKQETNYLLKLKRDEFDRQGKVLKLAAGLCVLYVLGCGILFEEILGIAAEVEGHFYIFATAMIIIPAWIMSRIIAGVFPRINADPSLPGVDLVKNLTNN